MIYRLEIGDLDNLYIITGGLTGLTEFEPIELLGTSSPVTIKVDSDDDCFTPIIKQSMEVALIKSTDGQFDDIIAGNDNETWGVLIENGSLYLNHEGEGEYLIRISAGGLVKFKGILTLETYTEQYREISEVRFTFHDRLGTIGDDLFYTNTQVKNVTDILACCVNKAVCSEKLYLEWPYTLSSSTDPQEFFVDVESFDGKKRKEVLETVLKDFGLQLYTDFSLESQITLVNSGALVVRSVINHTNIANTYWRLDLTSFVSSVCGREYFTYTGSLGSEIVKQRYLLGSNDLPLTDNSCGLELVRVASAIVAKNEISLKDTIIWRGKYNRDFIAFSSGLYRYCPFALVSGVDILNDIKDLIDGDKDIYDFLAAESRVYYGLEEGVDLRGSNIGDGYFAVVTNRYKINQSEFYNNEYNLTINTKAFGFNDYIPPIGTTKLHCNIILYKNGSYYVANGLNWVTLDNQDDLIKYHLVIIDRDTSNELTVNVKITGAQDCYVMVVYCCSDYGNALIKEINLYPYFEIDNYIPISIILTTSLIGNNRKNIEIESKIINRPNVPFSGFGCNYVIKDIDDSFPLTLDYKLLSQTLLAHLSDQYGWQYNGNRWIIDTKIKGLQPYNLVGQFALEDKICMLTSGDYDAKSKEFKGKFVQVLEIGTEAYRLLQDNFTPFTWDDGNYIMLN